MGYFFDTFSNFLSGLGMPGRDKMTGFQYGRQVWSREQLEASFQSDWIARKAISIPALDATREWRNWQAESKQIELIEATEKRLNVQLKLQQAMTKARLYGGCCILIGVDGDMTKELIPDTIKKDGLKFVHVFAPHQVVVEDLVRDISDPFYGQPTYYMLNDQTVTSVKDSVKIHPSRMVRLIGLDPPDSMLNWGWGDPMLQMIHDAVASAGTVMQSIATMISEAKIDVVKIPGLTEIFSTSDGTNRMIKRFTEANVAKSVINSILIDGEEEWQRIQVQFRGMPEVMQMYLQIAAGAADIPVTRFLGQSPAGMNSTGESDLRNYYDKISSDQELRLTPVLERLDKAIIQSSLGKLDPSVFYEWNPLWQMDDAQKATIDFQKAQSTKLDVDSGLIPLDALIKGRCNQLIEDGTYPGLESALEEAMANQEVANENELAMSMVEEKQQAKLQMQQQKLLPPPQKGQPPQNGGQSSGAADTFPAGGLLRLYDLLVNWDPDKHPRVESGEHGGEFTSSGGGGGGSMQMEHSAGFVSPSVKSGMDFKTATKELGSRQQVRLRSASSDINSKVGLSAAHDVNIIGSWRDGKTQYAENSVMTQSGSDWNRTVLASVMKGYLADQKAVLVFEQQADGKDAMVQFHATGTVKKIHENLVKDGVENHTIVPTKDGAMVYVVDLNGSALEQIDKGAQRYGKDNPVYYQFGKAEFIGTDTYEGTDRQQRDRAREIYQKVIDGSPVQDAATIWKDVRDHWLPPYEAEGYDLTPSAIIAENPNIKKNSVVVTDAAKMINERASKILQRDLGMDHIDEDNHTPKTDAYLANTIALELREGLIGGVSGADWYDKTMKNAMDIAGDIYPGMMADPNKKFIYTAALAITSQGETVMRNVDLADQAYTYFEKHGHFPTDIKAKKASIVGNLKKLNEAIDEAGGGEAGIAKVRQFFDTPMTTRDLTKRTGVKPGATLQDDMLYGSAMLGPKIGQGFYQNLNGNFKPITMDLWFMRAWGRITNTGVAGGGMEKQLDRLTGALSEAGMPVPHTEAGKIKVAADIFNAHEKAFAKATKEGTQDDYEKSELVLASERVTLYAKGAMVEQPNNGSQRKWITSVFNAAIDKVKKDYGVTLTPAGAQATWWWPEKILWEEMGVRAKKRDADYEKELTRLKAEKAKTS